MTAHSLIYAPLYRAADLLRNAGDIDVKFEFKDRENGWPTGFGDRGALERLDAAGDPLDLCLCDPFVLVQAIHSGIIGTNSALHPRVLAVLVERPALWAVTTPNCEKELLALLTPGDSRLPSSVSGQLAANLHGRNPINLGRVCCYDHDSTAFGILQMMRRERIFTFDSNLVLVPGLGDELAYLSSGQQERVDVVVTCDALLAYMCHGTVPGARSFFGWHRSTFVGDFPFTALIGREFLPVREAEKSLATRHLLRKIQWVLDNEVRSKKPDLQPLLDSFMAQGVPRLPESFTFDKGDRDIRKAIQKDGLYALKALSDGNQEEGEGPIFPESIAPNRDQVLEGLKYSAQKVWDKPVEELERQQVFTRSVSTKNVHLAVPRGRWQRVQSAAVDFLAVLKSEFPDQREAWFAGGIVLVLNGLVPLISSFIGRDQFLFKSISWIAERLSQSEVIVALILLAGAAKKTRRLQD